jgi:hypothetical protein
MLLRRLTPIWLLCVLAIRFNICQQIEYAEETRIQLMTARWLRVLTGSWSACQRRTLSDHVSSQLPYKRSSMCAVYRSIVGMLLVLDTVA